MTNDLDEHDLDQILQALSQAEPSQTLNTRILAHLDQAPGAPSSARPHRDRVGYRLRQQTTAPAHFNRNLVLIPAVLLPLAALILAAIYLHPAHTAVYPAPHAHPTPIAEVAPQAPIATPPTLKPVHHIRATQPETQPTHPAPPEPLTHDEKLLLQLAHQRNAPMEALRPDLRAALSARETADFLDFFPKPLPPERLHPDGSIIPSPQAPTGDSQ